VESLSGIAIFAHVAETRNFSMTARALGVSSSAVGKSISRLEERLGVRLFQRSTRRVNLTIEGLQFLGRCRRILDEVEAAELELFQTNDAPRGKLRISLPLVGGLIMPVLIDFMQRYPEIQLDLDFSDRMVDVIGEGYDAVIRTGDLKDSQLMSRKLGHFQLQLVASSAYLSAHTCPQSPDDLTRHACLLHKFPTTGQFERWPLRHDGHESDIYSSASLVCNTTAELLHAATQGLGIACLPDFMIKPALQQGALKTILSAYIDHQGTFRMLWPSNRHLTPKLRVFIDFLSENLFPDQAST
jgi:DNA-binding transcriptional LysR family regulator